MLIYRTKNFYFLMYTAAQMHVYDFQVRKENIAVPYTAELKQIFLLIKLNN